MATTESTCDPARCADIDCEAGRRLGCRVFCCRLLVRLDPEEREPRSDGLAEKGFVDKDPDGYCVHFDRERGLCRIWARRPRVCREYHCNSDFLLQIALRQDFRNLAELVKAAARAYIPREQYLRIPLRDETSGGNG
jgi:Fe-S-cluster containining protein